MKTRKMWGVVRRASDTGREFGLPCEMHDLYQIATVQEDCTRATIPDWDAANPVRRVAPFSVEEITKDGEASRSALLAACRAFVSAMKTARGSSGFRNIVRGGGQKWLAACGLGNAEAFAIAAIAKAEKAQQDS